MLTQLRRAGALDGLAGVAVGQFTDCADDWPVTVVDVLAERSATSACRCWAACRSGTARASSPSRSAYRPRWTPTAGTLTVRSAVPVTTGGHTTIGQIAGKCHAGRTYLARFSAA